MPAAPAAGTTGPASSTSRSAAPREGGARVWCPPPAGKTVAAHRVFNPADTKLTVRIAANGREVAVEIASGATAVVAVPLAVNTTSVDTRIRGDRRLVLLETSFN